MARLRASIERAVALHRRAAASADAAQLGLDRPGEPPADFDATQRSIVADLAAAAARLAPGWLGATLDTPAPAVPGARAERPTHLRIGTARPLDDAEFPVIVPTNGHLAIDAEPGDPRAIGLLRSIVLRLVAGHPAGTVRVRVVDPSGTVFSDFQALVPAGLMREPATDAAGLRAVLGEAEQWVRQPNRRYALLLAVAYLPDPVDGSELARIAALAELALGTGLQLVVAGWPPGTGADTSDGPEPGARPALPGSTRISLRRRYPLVSDPPDGSFGASGSLDVPIVLDPDPPASTVRSVCERVAAHAESGGPTLGELLPEQLWQESSAEGLAATVGRTGGSQLTLRLSDLTPHWMIGGRSGAGKTAFIVNVLYGLSTRYGPDQLTLYLLDFERGPSFTEFVPTERDPSWIPHVRAVGVEADPEYGRAVLRDLDAEVAARAERCAGAGVDRFADLRRTEVLPRIVCVINEFQVLLGGNDRLARESVALLDSLARKGRSYGVHLILASRTAREVASPHTRRDSAFGQFPVRIALPGGADVLDPLNRAAETLGLGEAIVNTAGGLGGPAGASRAHERRVEFPDPHADPEVPVTVRRGLWDKRPDDRAPSVFYGSARQHLPASLTPGALTPGATTPGVAAARATASGVPVPASGAPAPTPVACLGRRMDVALSLAGFPLGRRPGRHLAVLGPSELAAELLDSAARSLAAQHRPGTVEFVIAPLLAAVDPVTARLAADLTDAGHRVTISRSLRAPERDGYLFGFGLDAAPADAGAGLPEVLRDGPARGVHVFGWWRGLRRFAEDTGRRSDPDGVAGLVLLNVPAADASILVGDAELAWQPRPNRALLHDRQTGRTEVIVPFVRAEGMA